MKVATWTTLACLALMACVARAAESKASERIEAADTATAPTATTAADESVPIGAAGVRAYLDPITGELTDGPVTPEQREQAESLTLPSPDYSKVTYETRADGTVIAHGNGQFESTSTIRIGADDSTRIGCTQTGSHADHAHAAEPEQQP